jgi:hypothetical protein
MDDGFSTEYHIDDLPHDNLGRYIVDGQAVDGDIIIDEDILKKIWQVKVNQGKVKPYFYSPSKYKFFKYASWHPKVGVDFDSDDPTSKVEFRKVKELIEPQITVLNLNNYLKIGPNDRPLENSLLFRKNLDLFIKYQKNMVSEKIGRVNYTGCKGVERGSKLLSKFFTSLLCDNLQLLREGNMEELWEEVGDIVEKIIEYDPMEKTGWRWEDGVKEKAYDGVNTIYAVSTMALLYPPAFVGLISHIGKNAIKPFITSRIRNISHYKKYFELKKIVSLNAENFHYNANSGLVYGKDEYYEITDTMENELKNIKGSRYYYEDNYSKKSAHKLLNISENINEFVVFNSHAPIPRGSYYPKIQPDYYPHQWRKDLNYHRVGITGNLSNSLHYSNRHPDWWNPIQQLLKKTYIRDLPCRLLHTGYRYTRVYGDEDYGDGENQLGFYDGAVAYSEMKYYRKNLDNTWNVYRVIPALQWQQNLHDWDIEELEDKIYPPCSGKLFNPHHLFKDMICHSGTSGIYVDRPFLNDTGFLGNYYDEVIESSLNYIIYLHEVIDEPIVGINHIGYITDSHADLNTEHQKVLDKYAFTPHFHPTSLRDGKTYTASKLKNLLDLVYDAYLLDSEGSYTLDRFGVSPGPAGIIINYINWNKLIHTINYPFKNILTFK